MAAAASRQYKAEFLIGAKLLSSFKSAMVAAEARVAKLRANMVNFGKSIAKVTALFASLGAAIAAFGIGKVLGSLFEGAAQQAKDAENRTRKLTGYLQQHEQLRGRGVAILRKNVEYIEQSNDALAKQQDLSDDILGTASATLASWGAGTTQIVAMNKPMYDFLVVTKGVSASQEDMANVANSVGRAIDQGQIRPLIKAGIHLDYTQKQWKAMSADLRAAKILEYFKGFREEAEAAWRTPQGQIQKFQNRLERTREEIGKRLLPLQAKIAEAWLKILTPDNINLMLQALDWLFKQFERLTNYIKDVLLPYLKSKEGQMWLKRIGDTLVWVVKHWKLLVGIVLGTMTAMKLFQVAAFVAMNPLGVLIGAAVIALGVLVAAVIWAITNWQSFRDTMLAAFEGFSKIPIIGPILRAAFLPLKVIIQSIDWIINNWPLITKVVTDSWAKVKTIFITGWDYLKKGFEGLGNFILKAMLSPLNAVVEYLNKFISWINKFSPIKVPTIPTISLGGGGAGGGAAGGAAAGAAIGAGVAGTARAAWGAGAGPAGALAAAAGAAGAAAGAGVPVAVRSYGGPEEPGQVTGSYGNRLGPGDVAISPNLYGTLGAPGPGTFITLNGRRYHVADSSWYTPGHPTSNMVEIWGYGNQIATTGVAARAYQRGGIAMRPQLATLAERGPEAVLPARMTALSALLSGGGGGTTVHFTPNVTINGNVGPKELSTLDANLRSLSRNFIDEFKAAQYQERRLSYESGYS